LRFPELRSLAGANAARSTSTWPKIAMAMKARTKAVTSDWMIMVPSEIDLTAIRQTTGGSGSPNRPIIL
jgi:hypothetical protein